MFKQITVLDRTDIPSKYQAYLDNYVQANDMVSGNNSYFKVYPEEYTEDSLGAVENYGLNYCLFMEWLVKELKNAPNVDTSQGVTILYWW